MREFCVSAVLAALFYSVLLLALTYDPAKTSQLPASVRVELTPQVQYEIQKQVQREVRKISKPVLPMVAPNPKVKVKR